MASLEAFLFRSSSVGVDRLLCAYHIRKLLASSRNHLASLAGFKDLDLDLFLYARVVSAITRLEKDLPVLENEDDLMDEGILYHKSYL